MYIYNKLSTRNFSLKEHDDEMMKRFSQFFSLEFWQIANNFFQVYIYSNNPNFNFFWGKYIDDISKINKKPNSKTTISKNFNEPNLVLNSEFFKFLLDRLKKEKDILRNFLFYYEKGILQDMDRQFLIDGNWFTFYKYHDFLDLKQDFIVIDSRFFSFFKLTKKLINKKSKVFIYLENSFIYYFLIIPKKNEKRLFGLKIKI